MSSTVLHAPRFDEQDAVRIARELFGTIGSQKLLPSDRDQNFHIISATGDAYVLKIANSTERMEVLDFQNQAMMHIAQRIGLLGQDTSICPKVLRALNGELITTTEGIGGAKHFVRLLTYLPGKPFAVVKPHDSHLLVSLGDLIGNIDRCLEDFDHPAAKRDFDWDLKNAGRVITEMIPEILDKENRVLVEQALKRFQSEIEPRLADLRMNVIHNDGNDYNVLVEPDDRWHNKVSGIIDFGDMVHTHTINGLAIACAYAMMDKVDPLRAGRQIVTGYHRAYPLTQQELAVLFDLIRMRLCVSVCHSAHQFKLQPDNEYLRISERPAWALLKQMDCIHPRFAEYIFRDACGFSPTPQSTGIVKWLKNRFDEFGPIVDADLREQKPLVFDLSVGSPLISGTSNATDFAAFEGQVFEQMRDADVSVGIGRYNEARLFYTTEEFKSQSDEMPERRTIHLGIDIFIKSGAPVYAFRDGRVHSFSNNSAHLDYGPTIIIEHEADERNLFYTLYGHLSLDSLNGLEVGKPIKKGEQFASIGDPVTNGGWPPHLHFQIITDMFGETGNYPGVALPSQRDVWTGICPDPNLILGIPKSCFPGRGRSHDEILSIRRENLGKSLSISYDKPLKIVRGMGQYLICDDGQEYLDGVNNVCHVGHCHPDVVAAGQRQMAVLNTNTRYLHDNIVNFAEKLLSKFQKPLSVCFFVCTGSEANELALRMARTYTGQKDVIILDGAYHGNTQGLVDISPYKHDGPGGSGAPPWVHKVVMPDGYRGPHKGFGKATGIQYAEYVRKAIEQVQEEGRGLSALICESMLGCGGQIVLPEGYMGEAFKHVRAAGGVCIADEVQVGFGRAGSRFWAFETQDVIPDIVTLGKPIGNGHPLAAVVTTEEIANAFANGMEYFNTFGGNPVSCAIGLAVLKVIENEQLQENAQKVGALLLEGLKGLMDKHALIGDVRGQGLFVGIELVTDRQTLSPAPEHAAYIIDRMKDYGILLSTDGPLHNVVKIKPPIVFSEKNAGEVIRILDKVLGEDRLQI
ncbi:MAG: aminotransferase class III-fold pyridoxal phosphate-dependent enzyme [Proteobacteria bacterium]|nr:aminotransferase class III-fold pyridoxal phosphate-dependent enzyme [Pseudomonadota bacterium]